MTSVTELAPTVGVRAARDFLVGISRDCAVDTYLRDRRVKSIDSKPAQLLGSVVGDVDTTVEGCLRFGSQWRGLTSRCSRREKLAGTVGSIRRASLANRGQGTPSAGV